MIDSSDFQLLVNDIKRKWGKGRFSLDYILVSDADYDALVESPEVDYHMQELSDEQGNRDMYYVHGPDKIKIVPVSFLPNIQLVTTLGTRFPGGEQK